MIVGRFEVPMRRVPALAAGLADLTLTAELAGTADPSSLRARAWARRTVRRLEVDLTVTGVEHIEPGTSYLVVPLHESLFDPVGLLHLPLGLRFVARDELADWRWLGRYLRRAGHLVIGTERPWQGFREVLRAAPRLSARGESLVVFAQGSVLGIETAFLPGAGWLAERLGWPVLPVALSGGHRIWEWPFSRVLRFGQPMEVQVLAPRPAAGIDLVSLQAELKAAALASSAPVRRFDPDRDGWWDGYRFAIDPAYPDLAARHRAHRRR